MTATCPVCGAEQGEGLLCHGCTTALERDLGDVPAIVAELDITISKQARIGNGGKGGLARERMPINAGAMLVADDLQNTLTSWARDVSVVGTESAGHDRRQGMENPSLTSVRILLSEVPEIRRHPAVTELIDEIADAIRQARRVIDRPADRIFVGPCYAEFEGVTCTEDLYARPGAGTVVCKVCGIEHDVAERREWMLREAEDQLFSVREAAQIIGSYGSLQITESTIRSYVSSGQLSYHGKVSGSSVLRLGDLWSVIAVHAAKPNGRKLKPAV